MEFMIEIGALTDIPERSRVLETAVLGGDPTESNIQSGTPWCQLGIGKCLRGLRASCQLASIGDPRANTSKIGWTLHHKV